MFNQDNDDCQSDHGLQMFKRNTGLKVLSLFASTTNTTLKNKHMFMNYGMICPSASFFWCFVILTQVWLGASVLCLLHVL